jgi:DNA mismatch repair protein MutS2
MIPESSVQLLEFNKLLGLISGYVHSEASRLSVLDLRPLHDRADVEKRLDQIGEIRKLSGEGSPLALSPFSDISPLLVKIRPEGAVLDAIELAEFMPFLNVAFALSVQLRERRDLPFLKEITGHLTGFPDINSTLRKSIGSEGNILDSASFLLSDLRAQIRRLEGRIRKKLEEIVRDERLSDLLQDNFITTRSGRWVIPVRMDSKGMVPGVVHDISKSGETAFVEPLGIINLSNELENLIAEQKAEELRILRNICSMIRRVGDDIASEFKTTVHLDMLHSVAKSADLLQMETPEINDAGYINLVAARHPLLQLSLLRTGSDQRVVPLDVRLGGENTVMVITGANAGGKTIAIKTIGLVLVMALSGMPIPAASSSSLPFLRSLLVDIGDEQSIENNLSTFSAHISNISEILRKKDSKTVVLIDELGTGTDPDEGAALACAILKEMHESGALVFATTHLADIKGFVHRSEGMVNASMEFDLKTLTPLYRLRSGEPGQSHAIEIARRYGLPDNVIDSAKDMLGSIKIEFDHMVSDLNAKRAEYEAALDDLRKQRSEIDRKNGLLERLLSDAKEKQREILAGAYREASDLVSDTKRQMNALLNEIRKKEKGERRKVVKEVEVAREHIDEKLREYDRDDKALTLDDIRKGDVVYIKSLGYDAYVIEINPRHGRLRVAAKNMEIEVSVSDARAKKGKSLAAPESAVQAGKADETVSPRISLIGLRVEEALSRLEQFLNHAAMAELREVTVIHGIGKGLLSRAVHEHLTNHLLVKHFRQGTQEEGGMAVTVVTMK